MSDQYIDTQLQAKSSDITEFNNLLQERTFRFQNLERDVAKTAENIAHHDEDMIKITRVLQRQIDEKAETIAKYKEKLQQLESNTQNQLKSQKEKTEFEKREIQRKQDAQVQDQQKQMTSLVATQEMLLEFKNSKLIKKRQLENEEARFKTLLSQLKHVEEQGKEDLQRQSQRIRQQYTQFLEDYKKNAQTKAEKNISEIERNIQAQNQRLEDEAKIQDEESAYLEAKILQIESENEVYNLELQNKGLTTEEHSKRQFLKQKKIKMLKTKIDLLEKSLGQIVSDFEKERELLKFQNEQIIKEQAEELRNLQETTRVKTTELRNVRAICQMVLDQRSDIEQFFLESMEQVKEEKRLKLEEELAKVQGPKAPEFLPLINPKSKYSKKANFEKSQQQQSSSLLSANKRVTVELTDLDWEDRETVLRLLFSKMNTGEPATSWRDPQVASQNNSQRQAQSGKSESGTSSGQRQYGGNNLDQGFRDETENGEEELMQYYDEEEQDDEQE